MVKNHSDSERENLLPQLHKLLFPNSNKRLFIHNIYVLCTIPHSMVHTTAFVTPVMEHWLDQEIA